MGKPQTILDAIRRFRPHLVEQYQLFVALQQTIAELESYFSTIPKDIRDIIVSMIPVGLREFTDAETISAQLISQFDDFAQKYKLHRKASFGVWCIDLQNAGDLKLPPEITTELAGTRYIHLKRGFDGNVCFASANFEMQSEAHKYYHMNYNNTMLALSEGPIDDAYCEKYKRFVLPCGLILCRSMSELIMIDPKSNWHVKLDKDMFKHMNEHVFRAHGQYLMDDLGNCIQAVYEVNGAAMAFSEFTEFALLVRLD